MKIVEIPKKNGKKRTIYVPNRDEKATLQLRVGEITRKADRFCPEGVAHGFMRKKSPVTNALVHVGHQFTTCFDLRDFFDTVHAGMLKGKLKAEEIEAVLVDGAPRQGLPTSPAVANLAASDLDKAILAWRDKKKLQFVYTRYADDLTFSYDDPALTDLLRQQVPVIVGRIGFKVNPEKTRTMTAKTGRRIITGVAVDNEGVHAPRRVKRRLRAAMHQQRKHQAAGLAEWCKLKLPTQNTGGSGGEDDVASLLKAWKLPALSMKKIPGKTAARDLGDDCLITDDLVYLLGMSTFTTGWTSCMSQPNGQYRKGVIFWCYLRGTRVAAYLSDKTRIVAGVERRVMRARTLVHELRNGQSVYDRLYGNPQDVIFLRDKLRQAGILSIEEARAKFGHGIKVVGHAPNKTRPYLDSLTSRSATASEGNWKGKKIYTVEI